MKKYCFIADTGSTYQLENGVNDVFIVPIQVVVKNKKNELHTYEDGVNFSREQLNDVLSTNQDIYTSQPNISTVTQLIDECFKKYEYVIFLPVAKELSGFYYTLKGIQKQYNNLIVLDCSAMGIGGNWLIEEIRNEIDANRLELIDSAINHFAQKYRNKWCVSIVMPSIWRLAKSGRVSKLKALLSSILKLKVTVKYNGNTEFVSKDINIESAISKALRSINKTINYSKNGISKICIMSELQDKKQEEKIVQFILKSLNITEYDKALLPSPVAIYAGPHTFSIIIVSK